MALLQGIMSPKEGVGIGVTQLAWLKAELEMAEVARERVMVAAHDPLVPGKVLMCQSTVAYLISHQIIVA